MSSTWLEARSCSTRRPPSREMFSVVDRVVTGPLRGSSGPSDDTCPSRSNSHVVALSRILSSLSSALLSLDRRRALSVRHSESLPSTSTDRAVDSGGRTEQNQGPPTRGQPAAERRRVAATGDRESICPSCDVGCVSRVPEERRRREGSRAACSSDSS